MDFFKSLLVGVLIVFVLVSCSHQDEYPAIVNGVPITNESLDTQYSHLSEPVKSTVTKEQFLEELIREEVLIQVARSKGMNVTSEEVNTVIDSVMKKNQLTQAQLEKSLVDQGSSLFLLRDQITKQILISKYLDEQIVSNVVISSDDVKSFYDSHPDQFSAAEGQIRASHILVKTEDEASDLLRQIKEGANFADLASNYSIDPGSASRGGDLGFFNPREMVKPFADAAVALKVWQISNPVQSQFGYHIILRTPNILSLEDASSDIKRSLQKQKVDAAFGILLNQLMSSANITRGNQTISAKVSGVAGFSEYAPTTCLVDGKPVVRLFITSSCPSCADAQKQAEQALRSSASLKVLELDTGDNLETPDNETSILPEDLAMYKKNNPQSFVPFYDIGCRYYHSGLADANSLKDIVRMVTP